MAQVDVTVPGGATGLNVYCIQAGDITSGALVGTFLETAPHVWEERLKAGTFKLDEQKRDALTVDLQDPVRDAAIQFDFVNRTIKYKPSSSREAAGRDRYYILNATDKAGSTDCASLAAAQPSPSPNGSGANGGGGGNGRNGGGSGGGSRAAGGPGGGGGGAGPGGGRPDDGGPDADQPPPNPVVVILVPPRTPLDLPPGTRLTATAGPPCPGHPGFFLCPNQFTCAPLGGVCCPGSGACNRGSFCDHFIRGNCISPSDARFCPGTGDVTTGLATHCAPGLACIGNNLCQ